jgi:hypothetical protein
LPMPGVGGGAGGGVGFSAISDKVSGHRSKQEHDFDPERYDR